MYLSTVYKITNNNDDHNNNQWAIVYTYIPILRSPLHSFKFLSFASRTSVWNDE